MASQDEPNTETSDEGSKTKSPETPSPIDDSTDVIFVGEDSTAIEDEVETEASPKSDSDDAASTPTHEAQPAHTEASSQTTKRRNWFRPEKIFIPKLRNKLGRAARPFAIILILVLLGGASFGGYKLVHRQTTAPIFGSFHYKPTMFKLVSTLPAANAANVNTATTITLNFSQPIDPQKLTNNLFITPTMSGTFKQGSSKTQAIFTPSQPFSQGSKVSLMLNGTFQSISGAKLGQAYMGSFITSIPSNKVEFADQGGLFDEVTSVPSGQKETYTLYVGSDVGSGATITLYKGDTDALLQSLVYQTSTATSSPYSSFADFATSTNGLTPIVMQHNITDQSTFAVQQPDGLYLAVATDAKGDEVGMVWVNFTSLGVLARQDDQKTVLDAQSLSSGQDVPASLSLYNLQGGVSTLNTQSISGLTTVQTPYQPSTDIGIAQTGNELAIIPFNVVDSGGDIRVDQDLSTAQTVFGTTSLPTYTAGSTINFAGFVRNDNDAQYTDPGGGTASFYVANYKGETPLYSFKASIGSNGGFSASFPADASWLTSGDPYDQFQIFAASVSGNSANDTPVASFNVTGAAPVTNDIHVSFSQSSYLPTDTITASISATNSSGQPLANQIVDVHVFSQDYYENDPAANLANFGSSGVELPNSPFTVQLNSNGQGTYAVNPADLPNDGASQQVTLNVNVPGQSGVGAAGGASTIIHQGNAVITFGIDRTAIPSGDDLTSHVYVSRLNGTMENNQQVTYRLLNSNNDTVMTSGTATTNANGMASIDIPSAQLSGGMNLKVSTTDAEGDTVSAIQYYSVAASGPETYDTDGATLMDLNASGSPSTVQVGQTVTLNVTSPANLRVLMSYDRGRIYNPSMISLQKGSNTVTFTVDANFAPSFTLTFNYFLNGAYHSEGIYFTVNDAAQDGSVTITPSSQTIAANQPVAFNLQSLDASGNAIPSTMLVSIVSADSYNLSSSVTPSLFSVLYNPRQLMTNSTSSLSPIGSGGGRCGGGGADLPAFANPVGTSLYWQPNVETNNGTASITVSPPAGKWIMTVYAMSDSTVVGTQTTSFTAQ